MCAKERVGKGFGRIAHKVLFANQILFQNFKSRNGIAFDFGEIGILQAELFELRKQGIGNLPVAVDFYALLFQTGADFDGEFEIHRHPFLHLNNPRNRVQFHVHVWRNSAAAIHFAPGIGKERVLCDSIACRFYGVRRFIQSFFFGQSFLFADFQSFNAVFRLVDAAAKWQIIEGCRQLQCVTLIVQRENRLHGAFAKRRPAYDQTAVPILDSAGYNFCGTCRTLVYQND